MVFSRGLFVAVAALKARAPILTPCHGIDQLRLAITALVFLLMPLVAVSCASADDCHRYLAANKGKVKDRLVLMLKQHKRLCYFAGGRTVISARASYGRTEGKKRFQGDNRTPEGRYRLSPARASKKFGRFMHVSYPSKADRAYAKRHKRPPGSAIGVHGPQGWYEFMGSLQALVNHSQGCIVLDQGSMARLAAKVKAPVEIVITP